MTFKEYCVYYEPMRPEQFRAYCDKLNRVIRAVDCADCEWYQTRQEINERWREIKFKRELERKVTE